MPSARRRAIIPHAFVRERAHLFDRRPVTKEVWDEASGDTSEHLGLPK